MEGTLSRSRGWIILLVVVLGLAVAAGVWWFSGREEVPEGAARVGERLPADTPLLFFSADIETLLSVMKDAGLDAETLAQREAGFGRTVELLGHNPLTRAGLEGLGVDLTGSLAWFLGPPDLPSTILGLFVPLEPGVSAVAFTGEIFRKSVVVRTLRFEEGEAGGARVGWILDTEDSSGVAVAAILDSDGGAFILGPLGTSPGQRHLGDESLGLIVKRLA